MMMQSRGLLIAVLALVALGAGVWWNEKKAEDASKTTADTKATKLVSLLEADLVEATVQHRNLAPLTVRKNPSTLKWAIASDPPIPTDNDAAMSMVTNMSTLPTEKVVEENASDLIQFGLDPAQITLDLKDKNGKTARVLIGDESPVGNMTYARKPNEKKVYAIAGTYKTGFDKSMNDLRDKRMLMIDETKVARIELQRKAESIEFGKNAKGEWQILKPQPYRTDNLAVDELFRRAKEAKFDPALSEGEATKNAASFASATPVAIVKVTDAAGTQQLEVRTTKEAAFLGKSSAVPGVFKLEADLGKDLAKTLDEFRTKKLFEFGFEDPARIQIRNGNQTSVIEHKGEDYLLNGKKMDPATVMPVIDALRGWTALKFVPAGFTEAFFEVTITPKDGKTTEKIGVSKTGNFHYAKRDGDPSVYEVDPRIVTDLDAALKAIKEPSAKK